MKTSLTKTLIQFSISTIVLTVVFRVTLSSLLTEELWNYAFIPPLIYFFAMFFTGKYFGIKDYKLLPIGDIGFRFHLCTFLIFFIVSYTMSAMGIMSKSEPRIILDLTLLVWGILLLTHFIFYLKFKKTNIKGLDQQDIFE